jgi:sterol desaturase/sphingolipid hydroxylase (fatty acid hydroxylase superfamily)
MHATRLYDDPQRFGWWYLGVSYALVLLLQDTSFYFSHRLFHHPRLYRWFHASHHQSRQPTPWTSFAFDTPEAVFQAGFLLVIVMTLPLHWGTLVAVLATMSSWAVINHLGLERLPVSFPHAWLGRWFIGPAHHALHHRQPRVHYGLYFTFWDRWLGTEHPGYLRPPEAPEPPAASQVAV